MTFDLIVEGGCRVADLRATRQPVISSDPSILIFQRILPLHCHSSQRVKLGSTGYAPQRIDRSPCVNGKDARNDPASVSAVCRCVIGQHFAGIHDSLGIEGRFHRGHETQGFARLARQIAPLALADPMFARAGALE